jgi:DNA polymerase III sliding clamp (beta) subunit (PCNA family)
MPAVNEKGIIEQMNCFLFTGSHVFSYNDKISIGVPTQTVFSNVAVPANEFMQVLKNIDAEQIELESKDGLLCIRSDNTEACIKTVTGDLFNMLPDKKILNIKKWLPVEADFIDGVRLCQYVASNDFTKPFLNAVAINKDNIISSDNYRVCKFTVKTSFTKSILLPKRSAEALCKINPVVSHACLVDGGVVFKNEKEMLMFSSLVQDEFPPVESMFKLIGDKIEIPAEVKKSIELCSIFTEAENVDASVFVNISDGFIKCKGENDRGWIEHKIPYSGELKKELNMMVNPFFFSYILQHLTTMIYNETEGRLLFSSDKFSCIMSTVQK